MNEHAAPSSVYGRRAAFMALYLLVQAILIGTDWRRPDHAFAFQMFKESSTVRLTLLREIESPNGQSTIVIPVRHGEWTAPDAQGTRHKFNWRDRIKIWHLSMLDVRFAVDSGAKEELSRVQLALNDVASHIDDDVETRRLLVDVSLSENGRPPTVVRLASVPRSRGFHLAGVVSPEGPAP
jgi:hypothetical protein